MKQKFDKILVPIANELLDTSPLKHVNFNVLKTPCFTKLLMAGYQKHHQWKGACKDRFKEHYAAIEEGKADILGLYDFQVESKNEIQESMESYITTFRIHFQVGSFWSRISPWKSQYDQI